MNIHTVQIGAHSVRYANDNGDGLEPDAWKYSVDQGAWSPPFDAFGRMMDAAYNQTKEESQCLKTQRDR